jgi:hypothetical protein
MLGGEIPDGESVPVGPGLGELELNPSPVEGDDGGTDCEGYDRCRLGSGRNAG